MILSFKKISETTKNTQEVPEGSNMIFIVTDKKTEFDKNRGNILRF